MRGEPGTRVLGLQAAYAGFSLTQQTLADCPMTSSGSGARIKLVMETKTMPSWSSSQSREQILKGDISSEAFYENGGFCAREVLSDKVIFEFGPR